MPRVEQLLLRVDASLHSELSVRARTSGTSINPLANEVLSLGAEVSKNSWRYRPGARLPFANKARRGSMRRRRDHRRSPG